MKMLTASRDKFGASVPVMKYNFSGGQRFVAPIDASGASAPLSDGAYVITSTKDIFMSIVQGGDFLDPVEGTAGDTAGSIFITAGTPFHMIVGEGQMLSARGVLEAASVFIVEMC